MVTSVRIGPGETKRPRLIPSQMSAFLPAAVLYAPLCKHSDSPGGGGWSECFLFVSPQLPEVPASPRKGVVHL